MENNTKMITEKLCQDSYSEMTELVLPNDTNMLFNLMGGKLMQWMDIVAAISAQRHSNRLVVTASADNVSFKEPIKLGYVVTLKAQVTRSFRSSMEVHISVWAEDVPNQRKFKSNEAYFTFVALDNEGRPVSVPVAVPSSETEKLLFSTALNRRELRLVLAGKMKPSEAEGLKSLFT